MATKQDNTNSEEPCRAADEGATVNAQWNKAAAHPDRPSLYIHIPFCLSKCPYCSFSSQPGLESLFPRYLAALLREAESVATAHPTPPLTTLFLGGGTPTIMEGRQLATIVNTCRELFGFAGDAELSIEANPGTIDPEKLSLLRAGGFNRLSIGVQSLINQELTRLGRAHSAEDAEAAVLAARAAGFDNISLDLMYGLPGQDANAWQQSLERAIALAPDHLSLYELTIEQGTPFHSLLHNGQLGLPDEDEMAAMDQLTATLCQRAGFARYEISNYSRPHRRCRHNINYWQNGSYLALGAGAVACLNGRRHQNISDPQQYCERIESGQAVSVAEECLDPDASFRETVIMGLRMLEGVSRSQLWERYHMDIETCYGPALNRLLAQGLLELCRDRLRLTPTGLQFANQVMAELV